MRAAHIKRSTRGTSNEISFSVLDAAKNALDEGRDEPTEQARRFGRIVLFTLPLRSGRKKTLSTPQKESSLPPSSQAATPQTKSLGGSALSSSALSLEADSAQARQATPGQRSWLAANKEGHTARVSHGTARSAEEEIAWRKARRRKRRLLVSVACTCVVVALLALGGVYLYQDNLRFQNNTQQLSLAYEALSSTDELIVSLDEAVQNPLDDASQSYFSQAESNFSSSLEQLSQADEYAQAALQGLHEAREREAADALSEAAAARTTLIEQGREILLAAQAAIEPYEQLQDIWQEVLAADEIAREAAQSASSGEREDISSSSEQTSQAIEEFSQISDELALFSQENPEVDLTSLLAYINKRIEALNYALASNEALEARDTTSALEQNEAYTTADEEATALAEELPSDPGQPVLDLFEEQVASAQSSYDAARNLAATSDAYLRDYFGDEL